VWYIIAREPLTMIPVIDAHADLFSKCVEERLDWTRDASKFQASAANLVGGGVRLQWASIFVVAAKMGDDATHEALRIAGVAHRAVRNGGAGPRLVTRKSALLAIDWSAPVAKTDFLLSMEGASPLAGSVDRLEVFARLGMRVLGLTHNHDNECGDGCFAKEPSGLTPAGRTLAREAEARGVILDAAHLNPVAFDQVLGLARGPVVYSHGGSRELLDVPRNLTDAQARAIAATGGVLGVDFFPGHVAPDGKAGSLDDVVRHLEHWIEAAGPDAVGFGGDFDGIPTTLEGVESAAVYPAILDRLRSRGFGEPVIEKVAWRNWERVLRASLPDLPGPSAADNLSLPRNGRSS
jgi:membrane dipeptidase